VVFQFKRLVLEVTGTSNNISSGYTTSAAGTLHTWPVVKCLIAASLDLAILIGVWYENFSRPAF
jgi:hypothetical protein